MPVRKDKGGKEITEQERLIELGQKAALYLRLKQDATLLDTTIKSKNTEIKGIVPTLPYETNGEHKEITVPLGDGRSKIFIQIQGKVGTSLVDNILDLVKAKIGDEEASKYILVKEYLHPNTLETLLRRGLISTQDIIDWTVETRSESLIVKEVKEKK